MIMVCSYDWVERFWSIRSRDGMEWNMRCKSSWPGLICALLTATLVAHTINEVTHDSRYFVLARHGILWMICWAREPGTDQSAVQVTERRDVSKPSAALGPPIPWIPKLARQLWRPTRVLPFCSMEAESLCLQNWDTLCSICLFLMFIYLYSSPKWEVGKEQPSKSICTLSWGACFVIIYTLS